MIIDVMGGRSSPPLHHRPTARTVARFSSLAAQASPALLFADAKQSVPACAAKYSARYSRNLCK